MPTSKIMRFDFFATWPHFADHMAPIYHALAEQAGVFYVAPNIVEHVAGLGVQPVPLKPRMAGNPRDVAPPGTAPLLVAASGDMNLALNNNRKREYIFMEHGVEIVYPNNPSYAGNDGPRRRAALTLAPNMGAFELTRKKLPKMTQVIIGTPMLDRWKGAFERNRQLPLVPTVAISFHWDGKMVAPEAGTAFGYFEHILPELAKQKSFKLVAHAHPRNIEQVRPIYEKLGIEFWESFERVMDEADLYIMDNSSTIYMFLVTGKPVILLNSPKYRKNIDTGLRFWKYTDVGEQVDDPEQLIYAISRTLGDPGARLIERRTAIANLFPCLGFSAKVAAYSMNFFFEES